MILTKFENISFEFLILSKLVFLYNIDNIIKLYNKNSK